MNHSHARSPQGDPNRNFVHDAKDESGVGLTDDPHASYRLTPDLESESDLEETPGHATPEVYLAGPNPIVLSGDEPILTGVDRTGPRVRFRSRVRITAGMGRRRRHSDGLASSTSSISGSPSSSISAPLRTHYTGNNNGWGPLGTRVKLAASQTAATPLRHDDDADSGKGNSNWNGGENTRRRSARSAWSCVDDDVDERTRLLTTTTRFSHVGGYMHNGYHVDCERERERWWREQLMDEAFGKWPGRLLNRHWWWWHIEPVLCCLCESDEE